MLNKLKILFLGLFSCFGSLYAQNESPKVSLELMKVKIHDNFLFFSLKLYNEDNQSFTVYKPHIEDVCLGIFKCFLINKQTNIQHEIFPCMEIRDLLDIRLDEKNSVYLAEGEGFIKDFKISIKQISPYFIEGEYVFFCKFHLEDIIFITNLKDIIKANFISNKVDISYDHY